MSISLLFECEKESRDQWFSFSVRIQQSRDEDYPFLVCIVWDICEHNSIVPINNLVESYI